MWGTGCEAIGAGLHTLGSGSNRRIIPMGWLPCTSCAPAGRRAWSPMWRSADA